MDIYEGEYRHLIETQMKYKMLKNIIYQNSKIDSRNQIDINDTLDQQLHYLFTTIEEAEYKAWIEEKIREKEEARKRDEE